MNINCLNILFEDNHLLILEKPSGILTQPNNSNNQNLEDLAKDWIKQKYKKLGKVFLHCIHRLDKPVSGIVILGKTSKALSRLNEQSRSKKIIRKYLAEVDGIINENDRDLIHYLIHGNHKSYISNKNDENAKFAKLSFRVLEKRTKTTILEINLDTGRYHQIRCQLASINHPIVGDDKYGSLFKSKNIKLHCYFVSFLHPIKKKTIEINNYPDFYKK